MSLIRDGVIIILSSPSGAGKTTLVKKLSEKDNYEVSVSYTTRIPRINEVNGQDYYFISNDDFQKLINDENLLEYAKVFNNYYGSSKKKVFRLLEEGNNVLFDIDWQGADQIRKKKLDYKLLTFFILPPSKETLHSRLIERENKKNSIIFERMQSFQNDVKHWSEYDHVVINDNLEICYSEILKKIEYFLDNKAYSYDKTKIESHVEKLLD